jgi:hypothetical protein
MSSRDNLYFDYDAFNRLTKSQKGGTVLGDTMTLNTETQTVVGYGDLDEATGVTTSWVGDPRARRSATSIGRTGAARR